MNFSKSAGQRLICSWNARGVFIWTVGLGVSRPQGFPFNLNSAVDSLLKKEFDIHRKQRTPHPLMESYGIDAVPFADERMKKWRENFNGVETFFEPANFVVFGAVDDVWQNKNGELIVVDYKATSKTEEVNLDARVARRL